MAGDVLHCVFMNIVLFRLIDFSCCTCSHQFQSYFGIFDFCRTSGSCKL